MQKKKRHYSKLSSSNTLSNSLIDLKSLGKPPTSKFVDKNYQTRASGILNKSRNIVTKVFET